MTKRFIIFGLLTSCLFGCGSTDDAQQSSDANPASTSSSASSSPAQTVQTLRLEENRRGYCTTATAVVETEHPGFSDNGYLNSDNTLGSRLRWHIEAPAPETIEITIVYANGGMARPGSLAVQESGVEASDFAFTTTNGWDQWQSESHSLAIPSGTTILELTAQSADGLPNIDAVILHSAEPLQALECETDAEPPPAGETLAFPGAEGYGRFAVGGRHGEVVHVTNLNDSGPGSLREAISEPNRIVVFDVGGVIKLNSRLVFKNNQTIAGQTAPGGGITLYGDGTSFSAANNTIVRHIRFRMGRIGSSGKDTVTMANGHDVIWDHCSLSWGRDGNFDLNRESGKTLYNLTLQNSIVAQGLQTHSTGGLINTGATSILRSLYIDNNSRNPKARGTLQFVNNVIYNWVVSAYILGDTSGRSDGLMLGNYFIAGPESRGGTLDSPTSAYNLFARDNWYDSNRDGQLNPRLLGQGDFGSVTWLESPSVDFPEVPVMPANEALNFVIDHAGASLKRDAIDTFLIAELTSWGLDGQTISDESSLGFNNVVGVIDSGTPVVDQDRDGMADDWELAHGLDPNDASDAMQDRNADGWVNVEEYINSLVP